ncbi:MAG: hypothetical protein P0120_01825 [Nitrospira sp.]|nr:hypothetical protein [Nitrospira sp.]
MRNPLTFETEPFEAYPEFEYEEELNSYSELDAEVDEFDDKLESSAYPGISCVTPGNPYVLHCFPPFMTELTKEHQKHLDIIAEKIRQSFSPNRLALTQPITKVTIVGHSSTWHEESRSNLERRARERASNAYKQLILRLQRIGLANRIEVAPPVGRSDTERWMGKSYSATSGSQEAQNDRALNRRVEITLITRGSVVDPPLKNISRVWIFGTANQLMPRGSSGDKWRQRVADHGFTDVAIFVNGKPENYIRGKHETENYRYNLHFRNDGQIRATREFFEKAGIGIHLVTWIKPTKRYIEGCAAVTLPLCEKIGARSLLFDAEEPWYGKLPKLQLSQKQSQQIAEEYFCAAFGDSPCCLGVTHIVGDRGNDGIKKTIGPLVQACDYSLPQAYTNIASKDGCVNKPGCLQARAAEKWSTFNRTIVMGLRTKSPTRRAWEQDIKITDGINIMSSAPFVSGHIQEIAYWWLPALGFRERQKFFKSLNRRASAVRSKMSDGDKLISDLFLCPPQLRCTT